MQYTREAVIAELVGALAEVDQAEARLHAAAALDEVTSMPGLRYAPTSIDRSSYVVACDGQPIGRLWSAEPGLVIGSWTAARFATTDHLGPFRTARAAAAALARALGVSPRHSPPEGPYHREL